MEQAVCRRLFVVAARFRSRVSLCWTCGRQTGTIGHLTSNSTPYPFIHSFTHHERCVILTIVFQQYVIWTNGIHCACCEWDCRVNYRVNSSNMCSDCNFLKPLSSRDSTFLPSAPRWLMIVRIKALKKWWPPPQYCFPSRSTPGCKDCCCGKSVLHILIVCL
jgi:hypothetical protein